jgi:hypothetical protein
MCRGGESLYRAAVMLWYLFVGLELNRWGKSELMFSLMPKRGDRQIGVSPCRLGRIVLGSYLGEWGMQVGGGINCFQRLMSQGMFAGDVVRCGDMLSALWITKFGNFEKGFLAYGWQSQYGTSCNYNVCDRLDEWSIECCLLLYSAEFEFSAKACPSLPLLSSRSMLA